jgi:hypothetical protein
MQMADWGWLVEKAGRLTGGSFVDQDGGVKEKLRAAMKTGELNLVSWIVGGLVCC